MSSEPGRDFAELVHELFTLMVAMMVAVVVIGHNELVTFTMGRVRMRLSVNSNNWMLIIFIFLMISLAIMLVMAVELMISEIMAWVVMNILVCTIINLIGNDLTGHSDLRLRRG